MIKIVGMYLFSGHKNNIFKSYTFFSVYRTVYNVIFNLESLSYQIKKLHMSESPLN